MCIINAHKEQVVTNALIIERKDSITIQVICASVLLLNYINPYDTLSPVENPIEMLCH